MRVGLVLTLGLLGCSPQQAPATSQTTSQTAGPSATPPMPAESEPQAPAAPTCLARYRFDSHGSVLEEQRTRAGAKRWDDFASRYAAATIDPEADHPVERVADYRIGDTPLLWFTADYADAVVNAAVLGELKVVDATSLRPGQRLEIGALTELGVGKLPGRSLAEFLLAAGVIQTFVHIGADLCLVAEFEDAEGYRAEFIGEHEYYTNEENHDPLGFSLAITGDGRIAVTGVEPRPLPPAMPQASENSSR